MHGSVLDFLKRILCQADIQGRSVLEVGSFNVNGTPRSVIEPFNPEKYIGVDATLGPGVDYAIEASQLVKVFGLGSFDIVVSTEMLEHAQNWKSAVKSMKEVLREGGLLVVTTRSPGFPYHGYPDDHWRFTTEDFQRIFKDMEILVLENDTDPNSPGVCMKARKPGAFMALDLEPIQVGRAPSR